MSCVIGYANVNGVVFVGDGRVTDATGNVISENCKKVMCLNQNVVIGYAGDLRICLYIAAALTLSIKDSPMPIDEYTVDTVASLVDAIAQSLGRPLPRFSFLIGGINSQGRVVIHSVDTNEALVFEDNYPPKDRSYFAVCNPSSKIDALGIVERRLNDNSVDHTIEERLQNAISDIAAISPSVNHVFYTEAVIL